ncbi:MAG: trigger factor [Eubacteriales bacterium]|nr:trigger factor [Eubacteriales bacterium]
MKVNSEKLEKGLVKLIIEIDNDFFLKECVNAYNQTKSKYDIPGFRKGHATKEVIEKVYGEGVFFEDAVNNCIDKTYPDAVDESKLDVISKPKFNIVKIGKKDNLIYEATVAVTPEIKVKKYKGVEVTKEKNEVTEEEIQNKLQQELEKNAIIKSVDREINNNDIAVIDYEGFVDGKAFDGGAGMDYNLTIGSHSFIDNFEEQLIGHKKGDKVEVNVTFPKNYHKELANKKALFKVVIKDVNEKELPELNDEFASEISEFETLNDLKNDYKEKIAKEKEEGIKKKAQDELINKIVEGSEMDLPKEAIDTEVDLMLHNIADKLESQGISIEQYFSMLKKNEDEFRKMLYKDATKNLRVRLVLEKIAKDENIKASDEMVIQEFKKMAENYGLEFDKVKDKIDDDEKENVRNELLYQAVINYLYENAKVK